MNIREIKDKYNIVNDAMPYKYRLWKNNKVVKTGSTDKDSEQAMLLWAKGIGVAWDKVTLHDPKWKQLKVAKNQSAPAMTPASTGAQKTENKKDNITFLQNKLFREAKKKLIDEYNETISFLRSAPGRGLIEHPWTSNEESLMQKIVDSSKLVKGELYDKLSKTKRDMMEVIDKFSSKLFYAENSSARANVAKTFPTKKF